MIKSYTKGNSPLFDYAKDLRCTDSLQFEPGLNLIVGSNGCGKSTLLKTIATMFQCIDMAYAHINKEHLGSSFMSMFDFKLEGNPKLKLSDRVEYVKDSRISYLNTLNRKPQAGLEGEYNPVAMLDKMENGIKSNGEKQFVCINNIQYCSGFRENIEEVIEREIKEAKEYHREYLEEYKKYIDSMAVEGKPGDTFLIDDLSSEISIKGKIEIWSYMAELVDYGVQIIATTHDIVPFIMQKKGLIDFNLIELDKYMDGIEKIL